MYNFTEKCKGVCNYWGHRMPMMAMEEAGEFIQAISKVERGKDGAMQNLIEEMADMMISLEALRHHYGIDDDSLGEAIVKKLNKKY